MIIHKTSPFKTEEIAGILKAVGSAESTLVHFQRNVDLRVHESVGGYPPSRGLFWEYDPGRAGLLYTSGKIKTYETHDNRISDNGNTYFGRGTASPVVLGRSAGEVELKDLAMQVLGLSAMNWNSTRIANVEPITIDYARKIIPLLKAGLSPDGIPHDVSYYI